MKPRIRNAGRRPSPASSRACLTQGEDESSSSLSVRAQPRARHAGFVGFWNGMPKLAVAAPPESGRANAELRLLLAEILGLRASAVTLRNGSSGRVKTFALECPLARVESRLTELERLETERA